MDYKDTRNNRFMTPEAAAKNRVNAPGKSIYFFNAPRDITADQIADVWGPSPVSRVLL